MIKTASIIGTGNVATHLALSLKKVGVTIERVVGRDLQRAQILADRVGATAGCELQGLTSQLIMISVSDDAYFEVISKLETGSNSIVAHTSGSTSISVFESKFENYGVFYPLQTFSLNRSVEMSGVPLCIEASSSGVYEQMSCLAAKLSKDVRRISSKERQQIHIAAVFCSNFVNFLYGMANELLMDSHVSIDILYPLMLETVQKAIALGPENAQTGPAKRGDHTVIGHHLAMIENPKLKELYLMLSNQISNKYNS